MCGQLSVVVSLSVFFGCHTLEVSILKIVLAYVAFEHLPVIAPTRSYLLVCESNREISFRDAIWQAASCIHSIRQVPRETVAWLPAEIYIFPLSDYWLQFVLISQNLIIRSENLLI